MTFLDYFFAFLIDIFHFLGHILFTINLKPIKKPGNFIGARLLIICKINNLTK